MPISQRLGPRTAQPCVDGVVNEIIVIVLPASWPTSWILAVNIMYAGETWELPWLQPSRAQQRVQDGFFHRARGFLRQLSASSPGGEEVKSFMRLGSHEYGGAKTAAVPWGTRAGVPQRAAVVDTAAALDEALDEHFPDLARQCRDPDALLKPRSDWPEKPVKTFARLDATYPLLVDEGVRVGLLELAPEEQLEHLGGLPISGGAFAVPKDVKEDRWISPNETMNKVVDDKKMIKVETPYLPQLRGVTAPRGARLRTSKRDARHYCHVLRAGKRWKGFMAIPSVRKKGKKL